MPDRVRDVSLVPTKDLFEEDSMPRRPMAILLTPVLVFGFAACAPPPPLTAPPAGGSPTPVVVSASPSASATPTPTPVPTPTSSDDAGADLVLRGDGLGT